MKKTISLILAAVFMIALGVGIMTALEQPIEAATKGHLVYDKVDSLYYCLGTPDNCAVAR
ncbi:MAG: hypothetical protein KAW12_20580 [Candidatus Aminicenantes bacterium]|nr:hypothetical protein [Candidatus Aminicenantes bacterium]